MRVITGKAKGRRLFGPKTNDIRPAIDSVKEAVFNILGNIEGTIVLDLFAGTGSVGIEALSRGAVKSVFVDNGAEAIRLIRKNLEHTKLIAESTIIKGDCVPVVRSLNKKNKKFDLVFVDPPYDKNLVAVTLKTIAECQVLAPSGMVIVEHSPREKIPENFELEIVSERKYGQTRITFLKERP